MKLEEFDYDLPQELIAQVPSQQRDHCRLMVLNREKGTIEHRHFYDIKEYLKPGDCLVLNDSRVIPARLFGRKAPTGAHIEFLLIKRIQGDRWEVMVRPGRRLKEGDVVVFGKEALQFDEDFKEKNSNERSRDSDEPEHFFRGHIEGICNENDGTRIVRFEYSGIFMERLEELGSMPLPPYIERPADSSDKDRYQNVYSRIEGSVACPTAGLHFTRELLEELEDMGVTIAYVTLHVGIGTFRPVKCDNIEDHKMHFEEYSISTGNARIINQAIDEGRRIVSVGTTSTRTLESAAEKDPETGNYHVKAGHNSTGIFIYPGYEFKIVDALITNFHLPKSTLIMLISALYDKDKILEAYREAVKERYMFFSYGDAMLIE